MSDDLKQKTVNYFQNPGTIPAFAEFAGITRERAARRVKECVADGLLKATGKENRDGKSIRGQRPMVYVVA